MFKWLLAMAFERVYTVWDYYDGPRSGIADYRGQPHHYNCEWDEAKSDYAETFIVTPVDQETLALAMEQWAIWRQWEGAFHRGEVPQSTHPGIAGANPRYAKLKATLMAHISRQPMQAKRARPEFRAPEQASLPPGVIRELEVEWTDVEPVASDDVA